MIMFTEKIYKSWEPIQKNMYKRALRILEKNNVKIEGNVLDIGIGYGYFEDFLRKNGIQTKIIGIDPNIEMLKQCKVNGVQKIIADGDNIPFPDNYFDLIFSFDTIHLLKKRDFIRVLKKGGFIMVSMFFNKQNKKEKEAELEKKLLGLQIIDKDVIEGTESKLIYLAKKL